MPDAPQPLQRFPFDPLPLYLWTGLALIDAVIWSRRLAGALTIPLSAPLALGSTLMIAVISVVALIYWREGGRTLLSKFSWWPELVSLILPTFWGLAVGSGTTAFTFGGLAALWGLTVIGVGLVHEWFPQERIAEDAHASLAERDHKITVQSREPAADEPQPTDWQKRLMAEGEEIIEGESAVNFAPGQKEAIVHVSFCPPFSAPPSVEGEDSLGGDLEIRPEAVHTFGARISVRRREGVERADSRRISYVAVLAQRANSAA